MRAVGVVEVQAGHAVGDEGAHGFRVEELRSDRLEASWYDGPEA
ncbi:MAG: hypothetical protein R3F05_03930 [Planctomycetota bacterium]